MNSGGRNEGKRNLSDVDALSNMAKRKALKHGVTMRWPSIKAPRKVLVNALAHAQHAHSSPDDHDVADVRGDRSTEPSSSDETQERFTVVDWKGGKQMMETVSRDQLIAAMNAGVRMYVKDKSASIDGRCPAVEVTQIDIDPKKKLYTHAYLHRKESNHESEIPPIVTPPTKVSPPYADVSANDEKIQVGEVTLPSGFKGDGSRYSKEAYRRNVNEVASAICDKHSSLSGMERYKACVAELENYIRETNGSALRRQQIWSKIVGKLRVQDAEPLFRGRVVGEGKLTGELGG